MDLVWAQIKKDWPAIRMVCLLLWCLLVPTLLRHLNLIPLTPWSQPMMIAIMTILISGIVFLQDSATDTNALWMTMPISRARIVFSKLILITLSVFVPIILVQNIGLRPYQLEISDIVLLSYQSITQLLVLAGSGILAALVTTNIRKWLLVLLLGLPLIGFISFYLNTEIYWRNDHPLMSTMYLLAIAVLFLHYRPMRSLIVWVIALCAALLMVVSHNSAREQTYSRNQLTQQSSVNRDSGVSSVKDGPQQIGPQLEQITFAFVEQTEVSDDLCNLYPDYLNNPYQVYISATNVDPLAELNLIKIEASWVLANGRSINKTARLTNPNNPISYHQNYSARDAALGIAEKRNDRRFGFRLSAWLNEAELQQVAGKTASLTLMIDYEIYRYHEELVIPARSGIEIRDQHAILKVHQLEHDADQVSLKYSVRQLSSIAKRPPNHFSQPILRNPDKQQLIPYWEQLSYTTSTLGGSLVLPRPEVTQSHFEGTRKTPKVAWPLSHDTQGFPYRTAQLPLTDEWVENAELLFLSSEQSNWTSEPLVSTNFTFPREPATDYCETPTIGQCKPDDAAP